MKNFNRAICGILLATSLMSGLAEARVGGGRSFGNRGSRGFTSPRNTYSNPYRPSNPSGYSTHPNSNPNSAIPGNMSRPASPSTGSTFLKSLGAGIAGGMIGGMLSRAFGIGGGYGYGYGGGMGSGIGILEILLIGGLLFLLFRMFAHRTETSSSTSGAGALFRKARQNTWADHPEDNYSRISSTEADQNKLDSTPISTELAMDLFFKIQGAWANRELTSVLNYLDAEAREYLEKEISRLKAAHQINRLENIAIRSTDVVETWRDSYKEFSTVRILASLLDYTIDENTQQVIEGSKSDPVKFEEYWTFSRDIGSSSWRLSAIQQS